MTLFWYYRYNLFKIRFDLIEFVYLYFLVFDDLLKIKNCEKYFGKYYKFWYFYIFYIISDKTIKSDIYIKL